MLEQTDHQERSTKTFNNMDTLVQLYTRSETQWIHDNVRLQMMKLGIWNLKNYLEAKADRDNGGEGLVHTVTFDN